MTWAWRQEIVDSSRIDFREYQPEDFDSFLQLHNSVFPPVSAEEMQRWMSRPDVTAAVAVRAGEVVGEIPVHIREFMVRPGVTVRAAFEHSVCVAAEMRGTGVGTRMQTALKQFLQGRAEALAVYRGDERSSAYRFYEKNGLVDLTYQRHYVHREPGRVAARSFELLDISALESREAQALRVFEDALGVVGGRQMRRPGFISDTLNNLEMCELKPALACFLAEEDHDLAGYCVLSLGTRPSDPVQILELAARGQDPELRAALLRSVCAVAEERSTVVSVALHDLSDCWELACSLGFEGAPRGSMIMGVPLDWEAMARRVWWEQPALQGVQVNIFTPERDLTIRAPAGEVVRTLTLEMKHHQAVRYLFSRLDLQACVDSEMVTCLGATREDIAALSRAIPFTRWEIRDFEHI